MQIEFIDISSFRGVSANAEHYYAKVSRPGYMADLAALDVSVGLQTFCGDPNGETLRFFPDKEQARALAEKDNGLGFLPPEERKARVQSDIEDLMEDGTYRFPSIIEIVRSARKRYPTAVLYFTLHGSHKAFLQSILDRSGKEFIPEAKDLLKTPEN